MIKNGATQVRCYGMRADCAAAAVAAASPPSRIRRRPQRGTPSVAVNRTGDIGIVHDLVRYGLQPRPLRTVSCRSRRSDQRPWRMWRYRQAADWRSRLPRRPARGHRRMLRQCHRSAAHVTDLTSARIEVDQAFLDDQVGDAADAEDLVGRHEGIRKSGLGIGDAEGRSG